MIGVPDRTPEQVLEYVPSKIEAKEASLRNAEAFIYLNELVMKWWTAMEMCGYDIPKKDIGPMLLMASAVVSLSEWEHTQENLPPN